MVYLTYLEISTFHSHYINSIKTNIIFSSYRLLCLVLLFRLKVLWLLADFAVILVKTEIYQDIGFSVFSKYLHQISSKSKDWKAK